MYPNYTWLIHAAVLVLHVELNFHKFPGAVKPELYSHKFPGGVKPELYWGENITFAFAEPTLLFFAGNEPKPLSLLLTNPNPCLYIGHTNCYPIANLLIIYKFTSDLSRGYSESELQSHIEKLHEYNEIKDVGQMVLGRIGTFCFLCLSCDCCILISVLALVINTTCLFKIVTLFTWSLTWISVRKIMSSSSCSF